jgi:hypothetical protein
VKCSDCERDMTVDASFVVSGITVAECWTANLCITCAIKLIGYATLRRVRAVSSTRYLSGDAEGQSFTRRRLPFT